MNRPQTPAAERFWRHVEIPTDPDACWLWTGALTSAGYGSFRRSARQDESAVLSHRFAYELLVGPIPDGHDLDHTCHNAAVDRGECPGRSDCPHRRCVNPAHLEPATRGDNIRRGARRAKDVCGNGHSREHSIYKSTGQLSYCKPCAVEKRAKARRARLLQQTDRG